MKIDRKPPEERNILTLWVVVVSKTGQYFLSDQVVTCIEVTLLIWRLIYDVENFSIRSGCERREN